MRWNGKYATRMSITTGMALCALAAPPAGAQGFPSRPIHAIIPFSPGGAVDVPARVLGPRLQEIWKRPVVMDNRPGAGGTLGAAEIARSAPDGHSVLFVSNTHLISAALYPNLPYDGVRDFTSIIGMGAAPNVVVVHPGVEARSLAELFALAKKRPAQITYASSGNGSTQHLLGAHLWSLGGASLVHVPYKGSGPSITDLIAGVVQMTFDTPTVVLGHVKAGRLRAIAATTLARSANAPDVPTMSEAGLPGFVGGTWFGLLAPGKTPKAVIDRLHQASAKILHSPEVRKLLLERDVEPGGGTPQEFGDFIGAEIVKWQGLGAKIGIKPQ